MRLLGLEITRAKALAPVAENRGGWWPVVREAFAGAWQRDIEYSADTVVAHHAVYACITLIAADIAKLRPRLVEQDANGIWRETSNPAFSPVLKKPNPYQTRIQFIDAWMTSKLMRGNAYILKQRDNRGVVTALYVLDPNRVQVLVSEAGDVFYQLHQDNLSGVEQNLPLVPAREIIHDRMNCLFHPLVGTSPIFASGVAATLGLNIERNSARFFGRGSTPSGLLVMPTPISPEKSNEYTTAWNAKFGPGGPGGVAILSGGMDFRPMVMSAIDAQLIDQLKWSAETVASTFHVPAFKIGVGAMPTYQNGELLDQRYYSDCLQKHIEDFEVLMDEGLGLDRAKDGKTLGVDLDLDGLLRMDTASQVKTLSEAVGGSIMVPNEARRRLDLPPKEGGDSIWMQQQNYSLEALAERDRNKPFAQPAPAPAAPPAPADDSEERRAALDLFRKAIAA